VGGIRLIVEMFLSDSVGGVGVGVVAPDPTSFRVKEPLVDAASESPRFGGANSLCDGPLERLGLAEPKSSFEIAGPILFGEAVTGSSIRGVFREEVSSTGDPTIGERPSFEPLREPILLGFGASCNLNSFCVAGGVGNVVVVVESADRLPAGDAGRAPDSFVLRNESAT
jgi:hypothetical protein